MTVLHDQMRLVLGKNYRGRNFVHSLLSAINLQTSGPVREVPTELTGDRCADWTCGACPPGRMRWCKNSPTSNGPVLTSYPLATCQAGTWSTRSTTFPKACGTVTG